mmetsp:Transcript_57882/g.103334  ORF Transcript_57882/g.103334 Transcript_57882/m.103334 type:complete len:125 (-) Transcript_57882:748-1122(-)
MGSGLAYIAGFARMPQIIALVQLQVWVGFGYGSCSNSNLAGGLPGLAQTHRDLEPHTCWICVAKYVFLFTICILNLVFFTTCILNHMTYAIRLPIFSTATRHFAGTRQLIVIHNGIKKSFATHA